MENNNYSDKILRDMFNYENMNFDQDTMWNDLEKHLDKEKRQTGLLWFSIIGVLFLLGARITYTLINSGGNSNHEKESVTLPTEIIPKTLNENSITMTDNEQVLEKQEAFNPLNQKNVTNQVASNLFYLDNISSNEQLQKKSNSLDQKINKNILPKYQNTNTYYSTQPNTKYESINESSQINASTLSEVIQSSDFIENGESISQAKHSKVSHDNLLSPDVQVKNIKYSTLSVRPFSLFTTSTPKLHLNVLESNRKDWSQCDIRNPWTFATELYGGYAYPLIEHSLNANGESTYMIDWENAHSPVGGYQAGLQILGKSPEGLKLVLELSIKVSRKNWNPIYHIPKQSGFGTSVPIFILMNQEIAFG